MTITRPMLSGTVKSKPLRFPLIASPKLDGIRCLKVGGQVLSRSFKPIPNRYINATLAAILPDGADGEIMVGDTFQACTSGVMSHEGEPDFTFWMFDMVNGNLEQPYNERLEAMAAWEAANPHPNVAVVPTHTITDHDELDAYEAQQLADGFEGVMLRDPVGPYKCGRATENQGWLLKLKRFVDSEARIIDFEEQMHNDNEAETNELGLTKRSSAKDGKVPAGTLGKFVVEEVGKAPWTEPFRVGTGEGLTQELRLKIWKNRSLFKGRIIKYKYQPHGVKDAPRIPIFLGFRDPRDM